MLTNRFEEAAPRLERALDLAEALRLPEVLAQALTTKSVLYVSQNRLQEARILLEGALELALANDLHAAAVRAFNNLAVNLESCDRYREAAATSTRGLDLARRVGDRVWEEIFLYGPLSALVMIGDWDEALARVAGMEGARRGLGRRAPALRRERRLRARQHRRGAGAVSTTRRR